MKKIILVLMLLATALTVDGAQKLTENSVVPALTAEQHLARIDSLLETISEQFAENALLSEAASQNHLTKALEKRVVDIFGIIFVFGMPSLVMFFFFFFRYRTRKTQYEAVVRALEVGQSIPEELFPGGNKKRNLLSEGIKSIFTGLGLAIFLWAITGKFGIGCIGVMIMLIGIGQVIIHKIQNPSKEPYIRMQRDENTGEASLKFGGIELVDKKKKEETENQPE